MAKKSAKNTTADSTATTVLPNQIPTRFIAPVDKNYWAHLGDNFWEIPVEQFTEHPENAKIFRNKWKEQKQLENSIGVNGVLVPLIANLRKDGELRLVSGHRRLSAAETLNITSLRAEILEVSDEEELLILFSSNIARDLSDSAKIRFFKIAQQTLCHFSESEDGTTVYDDENNVSSALTRIGLEKGIMDFKGLSQYDVIEMITGFTKHEQYILVRVCDENYREKTISKLRNIKGFAKKADEIKSTWENLERMVVSGEISLLEVDKEVVNLNKQIESLLRGKAPKEKAEKTPKQPKQKAEKITLQNDEQDTFSIKDFNQFVSEYVDANFDEIASGLALETAGKETREHLITEMKKHFRNFIHALGERL